MVLGAYEQRIEKFTILYISIISFLFKLSNLVNLISCFLIEEGGNHMKGREKKLNFFYIFFLDYQKDMKERLSGEVMLLLRNFEFFFIIYTHILKNLMFGHEKSDLPKRKLSYSNEQK